MACAPLDAPEPQSGEGMEFRYILAGDTEINSLQYTVSRPGMEQIVGEVSVGDSPHVGFYLAELAPGDDYSIFITAESANGLAVCVGQADFEVGAHAQRRVDVIVSCVLNEPPGGVEVGVDLNVCPHLTSVTVTPSEQCTGESIDLHAAATDVDGDPLSYRWQVDGGIIGTGASSAYVCLQPGTKTLALEVTDGACADTYAAPITCEACPGDPLPPECTECLAVNCVPEVFGIDVLELCPPDDFDCRAVLDCKLENECISPSLGSVPCYCGSVSNVTECADPNHAQQPDGPCKSIIEASLGTTHRPDVIGYFTGQDTGAGRAAIVAACMVNLCPEQCLAPRD
ncbi:MAG: hypothetical protein B7733_22535 [Myxococcales bacterium FL481]|nr:MAG: hypothetical protein B7733_22535 [Myxococcales bacterium FL481]